MSEQIDPPTAVQELFSTSSRYEQLKLMVPGRLNRLRVCGKAVRVAIPAIVDDYGDIFFHSQSELAEMRSRRVDSALRSVSQWALDKNLVAPEFRETVTEGILKSTEPSGT